MKADAKHNNVMVAIHVINAALSELTKVAREDGERGDDVEEMVLKPISNFVGPDDGYYHTLFAWLEELEADLEPEK